MKKNRLIIGIIYGMLAAALLLVFIIISKNVYAAYLVLNHEGYMISKDEISKNLLNDNMDIETSDVAATPFSVSDIIYKKLGKYYLGDDRIPISNAYPLYINSASTTMQLDDSASLITDNFEHLRSYSGLYIVDGVSFNPDSERAYREEFIFQSLSNGLFINTKSMTITGNFFMEKSIPNNSVIRFMEDEIRYYSLSGDIFILSNIKPLNRATIVTINDKEYMYYEFLERLGLFEKDKLEDSMLSGPQDSVVNDVLSPIEISPTPALVHLGHDKPKEDKSDENGEYDEEKIKDIIYTPVEPTIFPDDGDDKRSKPEKDDIQDNKQDTEDTTGDTRPAADKPDERNNETQEAKTPKPPKAAETSKPAKQPDPVESVPQYPDNQTPSHEDIDDKENEWDDDDDDEDEKGIKDWKKPEVSLGEFSSSVYSIYNYIEIENSEFLYRTGVSFDIYENSRLIMRKSFTTSDDVVIGPLRPDTDYEVKVNMSYINKLGRKTDEFIAEAKVRTRPLSELEPIRMSWDNGQIFFNKIQIKDLKILNAIKEAIPSRDDNGNIVNKYVFNEAVQYMSRFEINVKGSDDSSLSYTFVMTNKNLSDLRNGRPILYETAPNLKSDTSYDYEYILYDRFGNILPTDGAVYGEAHTCKHPPLADIRLIKNEVKNIELSIDISNPDQAEVEEGSIFFIVVDRDDNPVETIITRKTSDGSYSSETECKTEHQLTMDGDTIKFLNLLDHQVYKLKVYCEYDINDSNGWVVDEIGSLLFTTVPVSSLGYAFFDLEISSVDDRSANLSIALNTDRTDERLTYLISHIDIAIVEEDSLEGDDISVYYELLEAGSAISIPEYGELPNNNGYISLSEEEVEQMKHGEDGVFNFYISGLNSMTTYKILILPRVLMGTLDREVMRDVQTYYRPDSFTTMKRTPVIEIDAIYASSNYIKLYGFSVNDPDKAVVSYPVTISVFDEEGRQVAIIDIPSADKIEVVDITRLERDKLYTFRFFANEFNNGSTMSTYRRGYELYYAPLYEQKEHLKIFTREAVTGSIDILQLNRNKVNYQQEILSSDANMKGYTSRSGKYVDVNNKTRFASNSNIKAKYSASVDFGKNHVNSFQILYSYVKSSTKYRVYLEDPDTNPNAQPIGITTVMEKTIGSDYSRWSEVELFNRELTGQHTLYFVANIIDEWGNDISSGGVHCLYGLRFLNVDRSPDSSYYANIHTIVNDVNYDLAETSYILKVYKNGSREDSIRHSWYKNLDDTMTLNIYKLDSNNIEQIVESKIIENFDRNIDTELYYQVDKGYHNYRFELWVEVFEYELRLDYVEFTTEKEIIGVRTPYDLQNIRFGLEKKYYVLNDISTSSRALTTNETFQGELDFRGHTLTYNSTNSFMPYIGNRGILRNAVFTFDEDWGSQDSHKIQYLVYGNYGTIQNFMLIKNNLNEYESYLSVMAGIVNRNQEGGIIENFVVKLEDPIIGTDFVGGIASYNRGIVRNGYIYGQSIQRTSRQVLSDSQYSSRLFMGGIVAINRPGALVENVFSLIDINTRENFASSGTKDYVGTIIGANNGDLRNSFSVGDVYFNGEIVKNDGPSYNWYRNTGSANNVYYYSDNDYGDSPNKKIVKQVLYDRLWYDLILNDSSTSRSNQFDTETVRLGYYPQLKWSSLMPIQEYIPLPELAPDNRIKILNTLVIEQGDDYAKAIITFDNPDKLEVTDIAVRWLNTEILSQEEDGDFYRVTVRLTQPQLTKYYSEYSISEFKYSLGFQALEYTETYEDRDAPTIAAEFYKPIATVEEWAAIKDDYEQNYRLVADLDFNYRAPSIVVLPGDLTLVDISNINAVKDSFVGKLDGDGHKISFLDTGEYGYVIGKLIGTVKNLTIEYLNLEGGTSSYKGFIGRMLQGSVVDNVHILGVKAISYQHCGAIAADAYSASILNSSAHEVDISTEADGGYTQYIGGLIGRHRASSTQTIYADVKINNCYVDTIDIKIDKASDCGGAGGLIGFIRASAEIYNVYVVNGTIRTVFKNTGGLIGAVDRYTDNDASLYILKDFYVDVDIDTITERAGGIIGYAPLSNAETEVKGLVLGNISSSKSNAGEIGGFYGFSPDEAIGVYAYELSRVNGLIANGDYILSYSQLCDQASYKPGGVLNWDPAFERNPEEISQGILPKLRDTNGEDLLPYQKDYRIKENPIKIRKIESKPYPTGDLFIVQIVTEHDPSIRVTGASFDGLVTADLSDEDERVKIVREEDGSGTALEYVLDINGYYDVYYLSELTYTKDNQSLSQIEYLSVGISPQYLRISSADEWNSLLSAERYGKLGYNIQITGDLDFSSSYGGAANGVIINNLIGSVSEEDEWKTIKNINMNTREPLIELANGDIYYLKFDSIHYNKSNNDKVNSFGLFSSVIGEIRDVKFSNIDIEARNSDYVGIAALSYGINHDIVMENISISSLFGSVPSKKGVGGLIGKLSGSGALIATKANNIIVEGMGYTGGLVGIQEDGKYLWDNQVDNAVVYALQENSSHEYVGGIVGYAHIITLSNVFGQNSVKNSVILGSSHVGGLVGRGTNTGDARLTSPENDEFRTEADNVFVAGVGSSVGGVAGSGLVRRAEVRNSSIYGGHLVGGVTGDGSCIDVTCVDSIISTLFDKDEGETRNNRFQKAVAEKQEEYQSKTGDTEQRKVYEKAATVLGYLITDYRSNSYSTNVSGNRNKFIGGISGRNISIWNTVVANCDIGAYGATNVGGIVGITRPGAAESWPFRLASCASINSNVYGATNIGGLIGSSQRGYIRSGYSNAYVSATESNAGGIAGYVKATGLLDLSETPHAKSMYFAGTVKAPKNVAGIYGKIDNDLFGDDGWLMIGDIIVENTLDEGHGDFFLNKNTGDVKKIIKSMVYEGSSISFEGLDGSIIKMNAEDYYLSKPELLIRDDISLADSSMLRSKDTYISELGWNTETITYSSRYYNYNGLSNGYMPYLTHAPGNSYKQSSAIKLMSYQEGYEPDSIDPTKPARDADGNYIYKYESYDGGIPIPGSGNIIIRRMAAPFTLQLTPKPYIYSSAVDKINIEFQNIDPDASFTVSAAGKIVADSNIDSRTFTLRYDFRSELEIVVRKGSEEREYSIWPEDVTRNVMTWNSDYYYIAASGILGSREELKGTYVNLYDGRALNALGVIYDLESASPIGNMSEIGLVDYAEPLHSFSYDGYRINTYSNYSVVDNVIRKDMRLYVKNGKLSAISSNLGVIQDSMILDSYGADNYCAVLIDGMIVDMTDSGINIPREFNNSDIHYMTHNLNSNNHILLVRYDDGAVAGFNYITGEMLPIVSPRGVNTDYTDMNGFAGRSANSSMANFASLYKDAIILETDLTDKGWAEINGINTRPGYAVPEGGIVSELEQAMENYDYLLSGLIDAEDGLGQGIEGNGPARALESDNDIDAYMDALFSEGIMTISAGIEEAMEIGASATTINLLKTSLVHLRDLGAPLADVLRVEEELDNLTSQIEQYHVFNDPNSSYFDGFVNADLLLPLPDIIEEDESAEDSLISTEELLVENTGAESTESVNKDDILLATDELAADSMATEAGEGSMNKDSKEISSDNDDTALKQDDLLIKEDEAAIKERTRNIKLVPVYDEKQMKFVFYEEKELLSKEDDELITVNEKLESYGHMVDYRPKYNAEIDKPGDNSIYGYILLSLAITGVALLLSYMLYRKHKEAIV